MIKDLTSVGVLKAADAGAVQVQHVLRHHGPDGVREAGGASGVVPADRSICDAIIGMIGGGFFPTKRNFRFSCPSGLPMALLEVSHGRLELPTRRRN